MVAGSGFNRTLAKRENHPGGLRLATQKDTSV